MYDDSCDCFSMIDDSWMVIEWLLNGEWLLNACLIHYNQPTPTNNLIVVNSNQSMNHYLRLLTNNNVDPWWSIYDGQSMVVNLKGLYWSMVYDDELMVNQWFIDG